jgi:hypothetical protein
VLIEKRSRYATAVKGERILPIPHAAVADGATSFPNHFKFVGSEHDEAYRPGSHAEYRPPQLQPSAPAEPDYQVL